MAATRPTESGQIDLSNPNDMHMLLKELREQWAQNLDDENFISKEEAEHLARYLLVDEVWIAARMMFYNLDVKASEVPAEGGGTRGELQRRLKNAGFLRVDIPKTTLSS